METALAERSRVHPNAVAASLGLHDAPALPSVTSGMSFLELRRERRNLGLTEVVHENAIVVSLQMRPSSDFELFADGRALMPQPFKAGEIAIFDLRRGLAADIRDPFHAVDLHMPWAALDAVTDEARQPRVQDLSYPPGATMPDEVARGLLLSIRPALATGPSGASALFVDHVAGALAAHVAQTYGGMRVTRSRPLGGLAPWQLRRAKEMLASHLTRGIALRDLASACELSVRHFTRAFGQSTGMTPHQWLLKHRLERGRRLLECSSTSLAEIATDCGFADQSHFSRAFQRATGLTPGTWRRLVRH